MFGKSKKTKRLLSDTLESVHIMSSEAIRVPAFNLHPSDIQGALRKNNFFLNSHTGKKQDIKPLVGTEVNTKRDCVNLCLASLSFTAKKESYLSQSC